MRPALLPPLSTFEVAVDTALPAAPVFAQFLSPQSVPNWVGTSRLARGTDRAFDWYYGDSCGIGRLFGYGGRHVWP